ncbi:Nuclear GTPase SLIP-GC, partial [Buceros rhinoceros silvestris]
KKTCKRDQNPEDGKEETLMDYKRLQKELKENLDQAAEKLSQFLTKPSLPETRNGVEYLKNHLTGLKPDSLMDPIYIGVFGSTGAGKSTLLNSIIDKQYFLPVSGTTSCTSCVVQVSSNHGKHYEAKIHLLTPEEWKDELKRLVVLAERDDDEDDPVSSEAVSKITAIYGEGAETKSYEELCRMNCKIGNAKGVINLRKENKEDFSEALRPYVSTQSSHSGTSEEDEKGKLWPLIKHVEVSVPRMEVVPEGVIFVDIPGMGDSNSKRDAMWKENINKCSVIWVVSSIERIVGGKNHEILLKEGMKAFQRGMCRDISLVVTKSDQINLREYLWEKKKKDMNLHDAILDRNENVKQKTMQVMKKNLKKQLPSDSRVLHKDDLVYTVSATEYWNKEKLSKEETEIPKLRDYIQKFYLEQKRDILKDYVTEALVIFSLIQSLRSNQETQYQCGNTSRIEEFVQKIIGLGEDIEKCFTAIERPLKEGVDQAKTMCSIIIDKILS